MKPQLLIAEAAQVYRQAKETARQTAKLKAKALYNSIYKELVAEAWQVYTTTLSNMPKAKARHSEHLNTLFTQLARKNNMTLAEFAIALDLTKPPEQWTEEEWASAKAYSNPSASLLHNS